MIKHGVPGFLHHMSARGLWCWHRFFASGETQVSDTILHTICFDCVRETCHRPFVSSSKSLNPKRHALAIPDKLCLGPLDFKNWPRSSRNPIGQHLSSLPRRRREHQQMVYKSVDGQFTDINTTYPAWWTFFTKLSHQSLQGGVEQDEPQVPVIKPRLYRVGTAFFILFFAFWEGALGWHRKWSIMQNLQIGSYNLRRCFCKCCHNLENPWELLLREPDKKKNK